MIFFQGFPCVVVKGKRFCISCWEIKVREENIERFEGYTLFYDEPSRDCIECKQPIGTQMAMNAMIRETKRLKAKR